MAKLKLIRTDLNKIEDGVEVDYVEDVKLVIASVNSKAYREHKDRLLRPYLRQLRSKEIPPEQVLEIIKPAVAHHILKGWKNIQDDQGADIPYSPQTALEFFKDPTMGDLYSFVLEVAGEVNNYRQELLEDARGN
jgi:hypothetical protein